MSFNLFQCQHKLDRDVPMIKNENEKKNKLAHTLSLRSAVSSDPTIILWLEKCYSMSESFCVMIFCLWLRRTNAQMRRMPCTTLNHFVNIFFSLFSFVYHFTWIEFHLWRWSITSCVFIRSLWLWLDGWLVG